MGLLDEYGLGEIDFDDVPDSPNNDVDDGIYEFEIGDVFVKEGSTAHPDLKWLIIEYLLGDEGKRKSDLFQLPEDPDDITDAEMKKLSWYKSRLADLGIAPEDRNTVGRDDLVGLTGTLQIKSTKSRKDGNIYQNITNVHVNESAEPEEAPAPAKKTAARRPATAVNNPFKK